MFATAPIRMFIVFAVLALLGFGLAAWTGGAVTPVLIGVAGSFAAAVAFVAEVDRGHTSTAEPWTARR